MGEGKNEILEYKKDGRMDEWKNAGGYLREGSRSISSRTKLKD
jgi:hypothetical protein